MRTIHFVVLAALILGLEARAHSQQSTGTNVAPTPNVEMDDSNGPSEETEEFSGTDAEGGPGFRFLGRQWTPSAFNVSSLETDEMSKGGRLSTYSYLTFGTNVAENLRFKLRLPFSYDTAGKDRFDGDKQMPDQLMMQDIILELSSSNFLLLPFDTGIYWEGRYYVPDSQYSRAAQMMGHLRNDFILTKNFTHVLGLEFEGHYGYYLQSRRSYPVSFQDENGFTVNTTALTKKWDLDQWVTLWAKVTRGLSVGAMAGQEQTGYNQSTAENKSKGELSLYKIGPSLRYQTVAGTRFILQYADEVDRDANEGELGRFLAKNTQISLLSWIRF